MKEQVISILKELLPAAIISDSVNLVEQGIIDSFDVIRLVAALDEFYDISIDGMDIIPENFATVDTIVNVLKKNRAQP